jgi:hypothetical protein
MTPNNPKVSLKRRRTKGKSEGEGDPIRVDDLKRLDLENMPEDAAGSYRY